MSYPYPKLFLLALWLLLPLSTQAQNSALYFKLSLAQGLTDATVTSISQDKYGFIWIGTTNGLNRFDGYQVTAFYACAENGLPANYITSLHSDSKGMLWVGTSRGLVRYDFLHEKFLHILPKGMADFAHIYCFEEDKKGNLYVGSASNLLYWNRQTDTWTNLSKAYKKEQELALIKGLLLFDEHNLYVSTAKRGFYKIDLAKQSIVGFPFVLGQFNECCLHTNKLLKLNDRELLVGTLSIGMLKFDVQHGVFSWPKHGGHLNNNSTILYNTVPEIKKDTEGRIWIATHYFGLAAYYPQADSVAFLTTPAPATPFGFEAKQVNCIFEDRQKNLWIGTRNYGVYRFQPNQRTVKFHGHHEDNAQTLQSGNVVAIAPLDSQTLMVGTDNGLSIYNRKSGRFNNFQGAAHYKYQQVLEYPLTATRDREGIFWIGSSRLGLMRYDPIKDKLQVFTRFDSPHPVYADGVKKIEPFGKDSLLLLNFNSLIFLNTRSKISNNPDDPHAPDFLQLSNIADFSLDREQQDIWIAEYDGKLYQYRIDSKQLVDHSSILSALPQPLILYKVLQDKKHNRIWCATNAGTVCIENGKLTKRYTLNNGNNSSPEVTNILLVQDYLWVTNGRSLARINTRNGSQMLLGQKDGIGAVKLFAHSLCLSPWGSILIGTHDGFFEISPDKIMEDNEAPPPYLTSFRIFDKQFNTKEVLSSMKQIKLTHKQNFFSFDLSAFDYRAPNEIEYAYLLEGFDQDWQYIGKNRSGSYTNVPGGTYTLKVKARKSGGAWNMEGQQIGIYISKPFWARWWFISLMTLCTITALYLWYNAKIKRVKHKETLRRDYEIKLNELEHSALRTQMNPHFIFNSLNTINSFINSNESTKANHYISKFSKLIRLILDHSRKTKISLTDEIQVAELYMQLEQIRFNNKFTYQTNIASGLDADIIEVPTLIIQPFIENAILHGLLPSDKEGLLSIDLSRKDELLLITIQDNGIGMEQAKALKKHNAGQRKSHGLEITLKRIDLFNEALDFGSGGVRIVDIGKESPELTGTRVEIRLAYSEQF